MEVSEDRYACGRSKVYKKCCGLIHKNIELALTAEDLMRSRYTAFTKGNGDYLNKSHHSSTRPTKKESYETELWEKHVTWLKLEILNDTNDTTAYKEATVEFKAYYVENFKFEVIYENSFFERENGVWKYKKEI